MRFESIIRLSHSHSLHGVVSDQNIAAMFSPSFILYMYTIVNFLQNISSTMRVNMYSNFIMNLCSMF